MSARHTAITPLPFLSFPLTEFCLAGFSSPVSSGPRCVFLTLFVPYLSSQPVSCSVSLQTSASDGAAAPQLINSAIP